MTITYRPQDKYAFMFTGPTQGRFMKDLENVFEVLTVYYNYPPANIMVVFGSTPPATPTFPGAVTATIASAADLDSQLGTFAIMASGAVPLGWKSALIYFTGAGLGDPVRLVIDGAGATTIDPAWLSPRLDAITDCHVNVVSQQAYGGGFVDALNASTLTQWSFTHACGATEGPSFGNLALGGYFTDAWVRGLKMEQLPAGTVDAGSYADQLGSAAQATNLMISTGEAEEFARQIFDALGYTTALPVPNTPGQTAFGGPQYLGEQAFLINDGSTQWWESPDIVLTHPNHPWVPSGDLWIPDAAGATPPYNNTIAITVLNKGTHPARRYSLGIELFRTGTSVTNVQNTVCDIAPAGGTLLPNQTDTFEWNTIFEAGLTHECIKVEAERLCSALDYIWAPSSEQNEAQRNTDEMTIVPPPPLPLPLPGLQGRRKHSYGFRNPFEGPRAFIVPMPEVLAKHANVLELSWFAARPGQAEEVPLELHPKPFPHLRFVLKSGDVRDILMEARLKPDFPPDAEVMLPFQVLVEGDWQGDNVRATDLMAELSTFAPLAGFTVVLRAGAATLQGVVTDREGRPGAGAKVFLRTVDGFQGATLAADEGGRYKFAEINPDVYRIRADGKSRSSDEQTVVLSKGADTKVDLKLERPLPVTGKQVQVILDRIRILNDKDPFLKGKGELRFATEVVPDRDPDRRQVKRLPSTGVYKVSQKAGKNDLELGVTLFDGVVKNRSLSISIAGVEVDFFDPDDELSRYHREFQGDPESWAGQYHPYDEYLDLEEVKDWALWYRIVL
jgi:hypothetical protein